MKAKVLRFLIAGLATLAVLCADGAAKPNVVFVLCDDLGYGDVHCMAPETCKIQTPSADRLATQGMIFTDAHAASSVCTPSRYALMTGRYAWRTRLQKGVVEGIAHSLIDKDRPTVAGFLKTQGYQTAVIGKWHLDFQYLDPSTGKPLKGKKGPPPVGATIPDGPVNRGFDYYLGFHHAASMKAVIENGKVIAHDEEINMLPRLTHAAVGYIEARAKEPAKPFLLYLALNSPHTPIIPSKEWQGKSPLGPYGDFVMQTDATLGAVLDALERTGLDKNTIVIFSSDNGCSKAAGIPKLESMGHYPSAQFRGSKADLWDGGHRVPFIVRWPGHVAAGSTSSQTICLVDFFTTLGDLLGAPLPAHAAEDSVSFLPALSGKPIVSTRAGIVHHSINGYFGFRDGKWKLLLSKGSGGWSSPKENEMPEGSPEAQLYDMEADPGETTNLYASHPEVAKRLLDQLTADIQHGRSTAGPDAENDAKNIVLWKNRK